MLQEVETTTRTVGTFLRYLQEFVEASGLKQSDVAQAIKMNDSTVSRLFHGGRLPSWAIVFTILCACEANQQTIARVEEIYEQTKEAEIQRKLRRRERQKRTKKDDAITRQIKSSSVAERLPHAPTSFIPVKKVR